MLNNQTTNYVIIVAGGKGLRMGELMPKQFLLLNDKPILLHTILAFYHYDKNIKILLVLPSEHISYWKKLCRIYHFDVPHTLVKGGKERFFSVKNALDVLPFYNRQDSDYEIVNSFRECNPLHNKNDEIDNNAIVMIHDGVRPFVDANIIKDSIDMALLHGASVPVIPLTDSIRKYVDEKHTESAERANFCLVQTPQTFNLFAIKKAYEKGYSKNFTDDASVYEANGGEIFQVKGNKDNLKITTPIDLEIGKILLKEKNSNE